MGKRYILSLAIFVVLFVFLVFMILRKYVIEHFDTVEIKFPFKAIYDDKGERLNIIAISAPFRSKSDENKYDIYKKLGYSFLGISSYLNFPNNHIDNPYDDRYSENNNIDYVKMVSGWLHCFQKPSKQMIESQLPLELLTEADIRNVDQYKPDPNIKKEYDFFYVCLDDNDKCEAGWQSYNRNWELAQKCIELFCKRGMKGAIVGRKNCKISKFCKDQITIFPQLDFYKFLKKMQKSKLLFVPNIMDASPRVITESLCLNIPVVVNRNIIGGWHNIISGVTGEFFSDENDILKKVDIIMNNYDSYTPRDWFVANRGYNHSGKKLAEFLKNNYPDLNNKNLKYAYI